MRHCPNPTPPTPPLMGTTMPTSLGPYSGGRPPDRGWAQGGWAQSLTLTLLGWETPGGRVGPCRSLTLTLLGWATPGPTVGPYRSLTLTLLGWATATGRLGPCRPLTLLKWKTPCPAPLH